MRGHSFTYEHFADECSSTAAFRHRNACCHVPSHSLNFISVPSFCHERAYLRDCVTMLLCYTIVSSVTCYLPISTLYLRDPVTMPVCGMVICVFIRRAADIFESKKKSTFGNAVVMPVRNKIYIKSPGVLGFWNVYWLNPNPSRLTRLC